MNGKERGATAESISPALTLLHFMFSWFSSLIHQQLPLNRLKNWKVLPKEGIQLKQFIKSVICESLALKISLVSLVANLLLIYKWVKG